MFLAENVKVRINIIGIIVGEIQFKFEEDKIIKIILIIVKNNIINDNGSSMKRDERNVNFMFEITSKFIKRNVNVIRKSGSKLSFSWIKDIIKMG